MKLRDLIPEFVSKSDLKQVETYADKLFAKMSKKDLEDFAKTKHKGLPAKKEGVNEAVLTEGVNDPNILKAIFLAGGPGSGKSYAVQNVLGVPEDITKGTSTLGLKVVNSDPAFEAELKRRGVDPKNLSKMTDRIFKYYTTGDKSARAKAKKVKTKLERAYHEGRLGLVLDGTGHDYGSIEKKKKKLEALGYDTAMIFVNTSLPAALANNKGRDRVLPDNIVKASWDDAKANMEKFRSLFGSNFTEIDNSEKVGGSSAGEKTWNFGKLHKDKLNAVMKFLKQPIKNPLGKQWIEGEKKLRGIK